MSSQAFNLSATLAINRLTVNPSAIKSLYSQLKSNPITIPVNIKLNKGALNGLTSQLSGGAKAGRAFTGSLKDINGGLYNVSRFSSTTARDIATLTGGFLTLHKAVQTVQSGFRGWVEFETQMGAIAQVTQSSIADMKWLGDTIDEVSVKYGASAKAIGGAAQELLQAGKAESTVKGLAKALALASKNATVGEAGLSQIVKGFISWQNVFAQTDSQLVQTLDKAVALSKQTYTEVDTLVEGSTILGKVWQSNNGTLDEMLATLAAVKTKTARPMSEVARGLSTVTQRITAPETLSLLRKNGVEPFDEQTGQFKGVIPVLQEIAKLQSKLGPTTEAGKDLQRILSGIRRASIGATLLDSLDDIARNMKDVSNASGTLEEDFARIEGTASEKAKQVSAAFQSAFRSMMENSPFGSLTKGALDTTAALLQMNSALEAIALTLAGIAASKGIGAIRPTAGKVGTVARRGGYGLAARYAGRKFGRGAAGIGAIGAAYAASQIEPTGRGGAIAKAGLGGATVGLTAFALGIKGSTSAIIGVTAALAGLTDTIEEARTKGFQDQFERNSKSFERSMGRFGAGGNKTQIDLENLAQEATREYKTSQSGNIDVGSRLARNLKNVVTPWNWSNLGNASGQIASERQQAFRSDRLPQYQQAMDKFVNDWVKSGKGIEDVTPRLRKTLEDLSFVTRDEGERRGKSLEEIFSAFQDEAKQRKKAADDVKQSLGQASITAAIANSIQQTTKGVNVKPIKSLTSGFESDYSGASGAFIGTDAFTSSLNKLPLTAPQRQAVGGVSQAYGALKGTLLSGDISKLGLEELKQNLLDDIDSQEIRNSVKSKLDALDFDAFKKGMADVGGFIRSQLLGDFDALITSTEALAQAQQQAEETLIASVSQVAAQFQNAFAASQRAKSARLDLQATAASFSGKTLAPGISNQMVQNNAVELGGSSNVDVLAGKLSSLFEQFKGATGVDAATISTEIDRTKSALDALADSATRLQTVNAELARVQSALSQQYGAAETFLTADPQQRQQIQMQGMMAQRAVQQGDLRNFSPDQIKSIFSFLDMFSSVSGAGGVAPGLTGAEAKKQLIDATMGPGFAKDEKTQQKELQDKTLKIMEDSAKASEALANFERSLFQWLANELARQQNDFLNGLGQFVANGGKGGLRPAPIPQVQRIPPPAPGFVSGINPNNIVQVTPTRTSPAEEQRLSTSKWGEQATKLGTQLDTFTDKLAPSVDKLEKLPGELSKAIETFAPHVGQFNKSADQIRIAIEAFKNGGAESRQGELPKVGRSSNDEASRQHPAPGIAAFGKYADTFVGGVNTFGGHVAQFKEAVSSFPTTLEISGKMTHEVVFFGAEMFEGMEPQIQKMVETKVGSALQRYTQRLGDLGPGMQNVGG